MQPANLSLNSKSMEESKRQTNVHLQLLKREDSYQSSQAINALQRSQISQLQKRLEKLEQKADLSDQMRQEATEIKLGLAMLQEQIEDQRQQLKGIKGMLKKLWDYFRPPSW